MKRVFILFYIIMFVGVISVYSVPPAPWLDIKTAPSHDNKPLDPSVFLNKSAPLNKVQSAKSSFNVVVIRVEFSDVLIDTTNEANVQNTFNKAIDFYTENSLGQISLSFDFTQVFTLSEPMSTYGANTGGYRDGYNGANCEALMREAIQVADPFVNYNDYDGVMVLHAGFGEESTGSSDDIWSVRWYGFTQNTGERAITSATVVPEFEAGGASILGTIVHELGHDIGDLPDLYHVTEDGNSTHDGIGDWGLMAGGSWNDNGNTPSHFSAWCKYKMGWVNPVEITSNISSATLNDTDVSKTVYKKSKNANEYFLIENRGRTSGYDSQNPGNGMLIYHIDESVYSSTDTTGANVNNNNPAHKLVDIEERDNNNELDNLTGSGGEATDAFVSGTEFSDTTAPNSKWYDGTSSDLRVYNISGSGQQITASFNVFNVSPPVIQSFNSFDTNNIQTNTFNIGDTIVFKVADLNDDATSATINISGTDQSMDESGNEWTYNWITTGQNAQSYDVSATIKNSGGEVSQNISVNLIDPTPISVTLKSPEPDAQEKVLDVEFSWNLLTNEPDKYILEIDTDSNMSSPFHTYNTIDGKVSSYKINNTILQNNTTYYWRVYAEKDGFSNSSEAQIRSFSILIDETAPTVASTNINNNATNIAVNTDIQITFSENIDVNTLISNNVRLSSASGNVTCNIDYNDSTYVMTVKPDSSLNYETEYSFIITTDVKDEAQNSISEYTLNFTTVKYPALQNFLVKDSPGDAGENFDLTWDIPVGVETNIQNYNIYYIEKTTEFQESDISDTNTNLITEDVNNIEFPYTVNIPGSIEKTYAFGIRYNTFDGKVSQLAISGPMLSSNDATIASSIVYEIQPSGTVNNIMTEYTLWTRADFSSNTDAGFNKINIDLKDYDNIDILTSRLIIDEQEYIRKTNPSSQEFDVLTNSTDSIEVVIGNILNQNNAQNKIIKFYFNATTSGISGEERSITISVENTDYSVVKPSSEIIPQDVDSDPDNGTGNTVVLKNTVNEVIAEVVPEIFAVSSTAELSLIAQVAGDDNSIGVNEWFIDIPDNYNPVDTAEWVITRNNFLISTDEYNIDLNSNNIHITFDTIYSGSNLFKIDMLLFTPAISDIPSGGSQITGNFDNSTINSPVDFTPGNADGDSENSNLLNISSGKLVEQIQAEIYPYVVPGDKLEEFTIYMKPYILDSNLGIDKFKINLGSNFSDINIKSLEIGESSLTKTVSTTPVDGQFYSKLEFDSNNNAIVTIISGKKIDNTLHETLIKLFFDMKSADINSPGENIILNALNTKIPGEIDAISGDAEPTVNSDVMELKIQKPAGTVEAEINPEKMIVENTIDVDFFVKSQIHTQNNSGVNKIIINMPQYFELGCETDEIKVYRNMTDYSTGVELNPYIDENVITSHFFATYDNSTGIITIKLGDTSNSDTVFKVSASIKAPDMIMEQAEFFISVDNYVSSSVVNAISGDADFDSSDNNDLIATTGNLIDDSYCEIFTPQVSQDLNSMRYASQDNSVILSALPQFYGEGAFGFNKLLLSIPEGFSNFDSSSSTLKIGEITYNIVSSAPSDSDEAQIIYNPEIASSGGTVEIIFYTTINQNFPKNQKNTVFDFVIDAPSTEGEYEFGLFTVNTEISADMRQKIQPGNTFIAENPTAQMKVKVQKTPANELVSEIYPVNIKPGLIQEKFTVSSKLVFDNTNSGVKSIRIKYPDTYSNVTFSEIEGSYVKVNGVNYKIVPVSNPLGTNVYVNNNTSGKYVDLVFGTILKNDISNTKIVEFAFRCDNTSIQDSPEGSLFYVYAFSDAPGASLQINAVEGNVAGNLSSLDTLTVISAHSVNTVTAEMKVTGSTGFEGDDENLIMFNSLENDVTFYIMPDFITGNRGINQIGIVFPDEYLISGNNPIVNGSLSLKQAGEDLVFNAPQWDTNTYYITLTNTIDAEALIEINIRLDAPTDEAAVNKNLSFGIFMDNHMAAYNVIDDSYNFKVEAISGNTNSENPSNNLNITCVKTPARGVTAEVYPYSTFINKDETFEVTLQTDIDSSNSGIDTFVMEVPSSLNNIEITDFKIRGASIIENIDYARSQTGNRVTLTLISDKLVHTDSSRVSIEFSAQTGLNYMYTTNEVNVWVSDSETSRELKVKPGDAQAVNNSDTMNIEIRTIVSSVKGNITPNFIVNESLDNELHLILDMDFNTRDTGVRTFKVKIPAEFNNIDFDSSVMTIDNQNINIIRAAFPAGNEALLNYNSVLNELNITLGTTITQTSILDLSFLLDAPANSINRKFDIEINNTLANVVQNVSEKYSGSLYVSTEQASLDTANIESRLTADGNGNWKIDVTLPFNVMMDVDYPGPDIYINGTMAKVLSYENMAYPNSTDPVRGVIKAYAYVPYNNYKGGGNDLLTISSLKDARGNIIESQPVYLNSGYGIALSVFINPVDRKALSIVAKTSEPLQTGHTMQFEVREFGGDSTKLFTMKKRSDLYSGVYKIDRDGTPVISASIYDNYSTNTEVRLKIVSREINSYNVAPELEKNIQFADMNINIPKGSFRKESVLLAMEYDVDSIQGENIKKVFSINSGEIIDNEIYITPKNTDNKDLLFKIDNKGLVFVSSLKNGSYGLSSSGKYVVLRDEIAPEMINWVSDNNVVKYEFKDNESLIESLVIDINGVKYNNAPHKGTLRLGEGNQNISIIAEDPAGNVLNKSISMVIKKAPVLNSYSVYPVPADSFVTFKLGTTALSDNNIKIYDTSGRLVQRIRFTGSGSNDFITWDLMDRRGRRVANGVYFYKIVSQIGSKKEEYNGKLVVIK